MEILIDILKVMPLASTMIGSYFWIRRNVWSTHSSIAEIAKPSLENNEVLVRELSGQRADSLIAWAYIVLSVLCQTILNFIPTPTMWDSSVDFKLKHAVYFLICCFVLYCIGNFISRIEEKKTFQKSLNQLKE